MVNTMETVLILYKDFATEDEDCIGVFFDRESLDEYLKENFLKVAKEDHSILLRDYQSSITQAQSDRWDLISQEQELLKTEKKINDKYNSEYQTVHRKRIKIIKQIESINNMISELQYNFQKKFTKDDDSILKDYIENNGYIIHEAKVIERKNKPLN